MIAIKIEEIYFNRRKNYIIIIETSDGVSKLILNMYIGIKNLEFLEQKNVITVNIILPYYLKNLQLKYVNFKP